MEGAGLELMESVGSHRGIRRINEGGTRTWRLAKENLAVGSEGEGLSRRSLKLRLGQLGKWCPSLCV